MTSQQVKLMLLTAPERRLKERQQAERAAEKRRKAREYTRRWKAEKSHAA